jgi:hypothetical protein
VPLTVRWLGPAAERILFEEPFPAGQYEAEVQTLPFTHVDVVTAMVRRWKLPELLGRPIERHHVEPSSRARCEPVQQLHRLAYCVGLLRLDPEGLPVEPGEAAPVAQKVLGLAAAALSESVRRAAHEFQIMMDVFRDVAWMGTDIEAVAERAHQQLVEVMDEVMISQLRRESRGAPEAFTIGGHRVEVECVERGQAVAYLSDARGRRLLSHAFDPAEQGVNAVLEALGLEECRGGQSVELEEYLRSIAA